VRAPERTAHARTGVHGAQGYLLGRPDAGPLPQVALV
jgi:hypothetical protein